MYTILVIREANGTRYHIAIDGIDATFAEIDVDADDRYQIRSFQ